MEEKHTQLQMASELTDREKNTHSYKWHQSWQTGRKTHTVTNGTRADRQGEKHTITNGTRAGRVEEKHTQLQMAPELAEWKKNTHSYI